MEVLFIASLVVNMVLLYLWYKTSRQLKKMFNVGQALAYKEVLQSLEKVINPDA